MTSRILRLLAALICVLLIAPHALQAEAAPRPATASVSQDDDRDGKNLGPGLWDTERGKVQMEQRRYDLLKAKRGQAKNLENPDPAVNYGTAWEPFNMSLPLWSRFKKIWEQHWGKGRGEDRVEARLLTAMEIKGWRVKLYEELLSETDMTPSSKMVNLVGSNMPGTGNLHTEMILVRGQTIARYIVAALKYGHTDEQIGGELQNLARQLDTGKAANGSGMNDEFRRFLREVKDPSTGKSVNPDLQLSRGGTSDLQPCGSAGGGGCSSIGRYMDFAVRYGTGFERQVATTELDANLFVYFDNLIKKKGDDGDSAYLKLLRQIREDFWNSLLRKVHPQPHKNEAEVEARRKELLEQLWQRIEHRRHVKKFMRVPGERDDLNRFVSDLEEYWEERGLTIRRPGKIPPDVAKGAAEHAREEAPSLMTPGCAGTAAGCRRGEAPKSGLEQSLAAAANGHNGGIDLRSLELRYLSDRPQDEQKVRYAFTGTPAKNFDNQHLEGGLTAARQASDAFFVWLSMRPDSFWVNLSPDEPDRIVDPKIGRTDVGRIMLQADLRMKKTVGELIHPNTKLGKEFWKHLNGKCYSFRNWIVPGRASVYATRDELYIVDAPLTVKSQADYLTTQGVDGAKGCRKESQATENRNEALYRKLILPRLQRAVNKAPEYAQLRRIYLSRIAAEWYRARSTKHHTTYSSLINSGDVSRWPHNGAWKPRDTFDAYVDSYRNGEFKVKNRTRKGNYIYTNTYVYGGVDWSKLNIHQMSRQSFEQQAPGLAADTKQAVDGRTKTNGDQVLVGGTVPQRAPDRGGHTGGIPTWGYLAGLGVLLLGTTTLVLKRRLRHRNQPRSFT
ncbi:hypothetical protein [Streptomyces sp. NPDC048442]|uniref:hypothetical protein n=1 Tax=Streptomyces sp. NPDC048442 TaxID=3154823 RepID=UPI003433A834